LHNQDLQADHSTSSGFVTKKQAAHDVATITNVQAWIIQIKLRFSKVNLTVAEKITLFSIETTTKVL